MNHIGNIILFVTLYIQLYPFKNNGLIYYKEI